MNGALGAEVAETVAAHGAAEPPGGGSWHREPLAPRQQRQALPRLLVPANGPVEDLAAHDARYGPLPRLGGTRGISHKHFAQALIAEVERAGLRGRGGAAFPTATKLAAVAGRRGAVVVVNATEGEPASCKDAVLAQTAPHLVIDGAVVAAAAVGARDVYLCVDRLDTATWHALDAAAARRPAGEPPVAVYAAPAHYVSGESTALARWVGGGEARPVFGARPDQRGVRGRPTLVQNAETVAHLALIARHGAAWFRSLGTPTEPGSMLVTVVGDVARPGVLEVAIGTPVRAIIERAGSVARPQAVLFGGYGGQWVPYATASELRLSNESLNAAGASIGAGLVAVLGEHRCGLAETARLARWFASESAGQCGPCRFGLPAVAGALEDLASGAGRAPDRKRLARWLVEIEGRGACAHPDLAVRMVSSALRTFAADAERHARSAPCPGRREAPLLPVPDLAAEPWQ